MSDLLRDYHFNSLKNFVETLENSEWSSVGKEIADSYLLQLRNNFQQVLKDTKTLGRNSGRHMLAEAERMYKACEQTIHTHISTMNGDNSFFVGRGSQFRPELPPQVEDIISFSGELVDWCDFFERFNISVHSNRRLTDAEKLRQLLRAVSGNAARLLGHWELCDNNYMRAIEKLKSVYGNKYLIARSHLRVMEMRPQIDSSFESLEKLIEEIDKLETTFFKLDMPPGHWEPTIITIVEKRLDQITHEIWVGIRQGDNFGMPVLADMLKFLRGRKLAVSFSSGARASEHMFSSYGTEICDNTSPPKLEEIQPKSRNSGRKSLKNGDCYICRGAVLQDQIECQDCPAVVHFCCLKNAGVVKNKKEARHWKCNKCLRCASCYSTNKMVIFFLYWNQLSRFQFPFQNRFVLFTDCFCVVCFVFGTGFTQEMRFVLQGLSRQMQPGCSG